MTYGSWLKLSLPTRHKVAQVFNITKRGPTHVDSNIVVNDGYNIHEVEAALTPLVLQAYTGSDETDPTILFDLMIAKIEGRKEDIIQPPVQVPKVEVKKKGGRPKKK